MFSKFDEDAQKILINARKEMTLLKHPYVGSEHLLLAMLAIPSLEITKRLKEYQLTYDTFKEQLIEVIGIGSDANDWFLYTPLLKRVMETAILNSKEVSDGVILTAKINNLPQSNGHCKRKIFRFSYTRRQFLYWKRER